MTRKLNKVDVPGNTDKPLDVSRINELKPKIYELKQNNEYIYG